MEMKKNIKLWPKGKDKQTEQTVVTGRQTGGFRCVYLKLCPAAASGSRPGGRWCGAARPLSPWWQTEHLCLFIKLQTCWVTVKRTKQLTFIPPLPPLLSPRLSDLLEPGVLEHSSGGGQRAVKPSDWTRGSLKHRWRGAAFSVTLVIFTPEHWSCFTCGPGETRCMFPHWWDIYSRMKSALCSSETYLLVLDVSLTHSL